MCLATLESCDSLGEAPAESTISIIDAHQACPHTGNPTKPARRQMTAPQRQHRWLAADHLEQKSWATLRSLGGTTERRVWRSGEGNYEGGERGSQSEEQDEETNKGKESRCRMRGEEQKQLSCL